MSYTDLWRLLTILSLLLLPVDVAVRRVAVSPEQAAELYYSLVEKVKGRRAEVRERKAAQPARSETMSVLLKTKNDVPTASSTDEPVIWIEKVDMAQPLKVDSPKPADSADGSGVTSRLLEAKKRAKEKNL